MEGERPSPVADKWIQRRRFYLHLLRCHDYPEDLGKMLEHVARGIKCKRNDNKAVVYVAPDAAYKNRNKTRWIVVVEWEDTQGLIQTCVEFAAAEEKLVRKGTKGFTVLKLKIEKGDKPDRFIAEVVPPEDAGSQESDKKRLRSSIGEDNGIDDDDDNNRKNNNDDEIEGVVVPMRREDAAWLQTEVNVALLTQYFSATSLDLTAQRDRVAYNVVERIAMEPSQVNVLLEVDEGIRSTERFKAYLGLIGGAYGRWKSLHKPGKKITRLMDAFNLLISSKLHSVVSRAHEALSREGLLRQDFAFEDEQDGCVLLEKDNRRVEIMEDVASFDGILGTLQSVFCFMVHGHDRYCMEAREWGMRQAFDDDVKCHCPKFDDNGDLVFQQEDTSMSFRFRFECQLFMYVYWNCYVHLRYDMFLDNTPDRAERTLQLARMIFPKLNDCTGSVDVSFEELMSVRSDVSKCSSYGQDAMKAVEAGVLLLRSREVFLKLLSTRYKVLMQSMLCVFKHVATIESVLDAEFSPCFSSEEAQRLRVSRNVMIAGKAHLLLGGAVGALCIHLVESYHFDELTYEPARSFVYQNAKLSQPFGGPFF